MLTRRLVCAQLKLDVQNLASGRHSWAFRGLTDRIQNWPGGNSWLTISNFSGQLRLARPGSPTAQLKAATAQVQRQKWKLIMSRFRCRTIFQSVASYHGCGVSGPIGGIKQGKWIVKRCLIQPISATCGPNHSSFTDLSLQSTPSLRMLVMTKVILQLFARLGTRPLL